MLTFQSHRFVCTNSYAKFTQLSQTETTMGVGGRLLMAMVMNARRPAGCLPGGTGGGRPCEQSSEDKLDATFVQINSIRVYIVWSNPTYPQRSHLRKEKEGGRRGIVEE
jgi:hypothetical protein